MCFFSESGTILGSGSSPGARVIISPSGKWKREVCSGRSILMTLEFRSVLRENKVNSVLSLRSHIL